MDIIILIFLAIRMAGLIERKGLPLTRWILSFVLAWIAGEFAGMFIGLMIFGADNIISIALLGLAGAFTAYFIFKNYLDKLADVRDDNDINNFGG